MLAQISKLALLALAAAPASASNPKRGLISDLASSTYKMDAARLTSPDITKVSWYYSFGHYPDALFSKRYQFTMQQFGVMTTPDNGNNFQNLNTLAASVAQTKPKHLMTFLEPAIHGITVDQAVAAWRKYISPLRKQYPNMTIGSPSVINGDASKPWIKSFIAKCPDCEFDFVDVHYYWVFEEFQKFVKSWHAEFPKKPLWISDIGFQSYPSTGPECKQGDRKCVPMIKEMVTWMDKQHYINRYTIRGEFRTSQGQPHQPLWSFLDDQGNYTALGKWYLGIK